MEEGAAVLRPRPAVDLDDRRTLPPPRPVRGPEQPALDPRPVEAREGEPQRPRQLQLAP